jgi:hypothetical protein
MFVFIKFLMILFFFSVFYFLDCFSVNHLVSFMDANQSLDSTLDYLSKEKALFEDKDYFTTDWEGYKYHESLDPETVHWCRNCLMIQTGFYALAIVIEIITILYGPK